MIVHSTKQPLNLPLSKGRFEIAGEGGPQPAQSPEVHYLLRSGPFESSGTGRHYCRLRLQAAIGLARLAPTTGSQILRLKTQYTPCYLHLINELSILLAWALIS